MRLSGRLGFLPSGDWDSGNPAFAISRGSPGTPPCTPQQWLPVSWHAVFPVHLSDHGSAIRSKDTSSSPCPLRGLYSSAPRGSRNLSDSGCSAAQASNLVVALKVWRRSRKWMPGRPAWPLRAATRGGSSCCAAGTPVGLVNMSALSVQVEALESMLLSSALSMSG